jgi:hypothetical protein
MWTCHARALTGVIDPDLTSKASHSRSPDGANAHSISTTSTCRTMLLVFTLAGSTTMACRCWCKRPSSAIRITDSSSCSVADVAG